MMDTEPLVPLLPGAVAVGQLEPPVPAEPTTMETAEPAAKVLGEYALIDCPPAPPCPPLEIAPAPPEAPPPVVLELPPDAVPAVPAAP